jgi:drug/metabolite transporter (DMT)-like permease
VYKASQAVGGGFRYSTTSAITIAEGAKLVISLTMHFFDASHRQSNTSALASATGRIREQLSLSAVFHIWTLSFLYAFNNQLSFFTYTMADPGTVYLFKAASTLIVAIVQTVFAGKRFSLEQWRSLLMQGCGMVVVQYDPCKQQTIYPPLTYGCLVASAVITAICTARNEYLIKNYKIGLHVQNMTLYAGGLWMNLLAFLLVPNPNSIQAKIGFFEGYDNWLAIMVVVANALIGLAINAVYKFADAITKCISQDLTSVILCIISAFFFGLKTSLLTWCGVATVCLAVHAYASAPKVPPIPQTDAERKKQ